MKRQKCPKLPTPKYFIGDQIVFKSKRYHDRQKKHSGDITGLYVGWECDEKKWKVFYDVPDPEGGDFDVWEEEITGLSK